MSPAVRLDLLDEPGGAVHQRLLLALTALDLSAARIARVRGLAADPELDRGAFLDAAARHKVLPLIGRHVQRHRLDRGPGALPHPWVLASTYTASRARSAALADMFGPLQHDLAGSGVRYALRRGFALGEGVLGDPAVRRTGDLDLALHPDDASAAHTVLTRLGYAQGTLDTESERVLPCPTGDDAEGPARDEAGEFLPYRAAGRRLEVPEFYVDLCPVLPEPPLGLPGLPMAEVLARARPAVRCGTPTTELHPADQLIDLWAQFSGPARSLLEGKPAGALPLSRLLDVATLSASLTAGDWDDVRGLAHRHGLWPAIDAVPRLSALLFPRTVPASFTEVPVTAPDLVSRLVA